jgi:hypothetical protein
MDFSSQKFCNDMSLGQNGHWDKAVLGQNILSKFATKRPHFHGYFVLRRLCPKDSSVAGTLQPGKERPRTFRPGTFRQGTFLNLLNIMRLFLYEASFSYFF